MNEENKQVVVTCDNCKSTMALSEALTEKEANKTKSRITINPFGAPRCKKCKAEPYSDINLAHTIKVEDFSADRKIDN